jgi:hypothetical protein
MMALETVSERDLCTLAGIVSDHRSDLGAYGLPPSLLLELMSQIRCDGIAFDGYDSGRQRTVFLQHHPGGAELSVEQEWNAVHWHTTGMYCDIYRPWGGEHDLMLTLPAAPSPASAPGQTVRLFFFRVGPPSPAPSLTGSPPLTRNDSDTGACPGQLSLRRGEAEA